MPFKIIFRLLCLLLFLPLALTVSVRPVFSAVPSYYAAREYAPDNACVCPPGLVPAQLRATQPSRLAYNTIDSASKHMTAAGGTSITYTSAGNISAIGADTLVYNKANQLATATVSGTASAYVYDAFGQRLTSTVGAGTPVIQQYGMGGALLSEIQGAAETNYVYLNGMPIASINTASPAISYVHTNHLGTPQKATNSGQSVVWSGAYQPFGAVTPTTSITQNLRFPGQYADPTGFNYNMFRNYNPALGRYLESDPIGLAGGLNTYNYAINNPYKYIDPDGLMVEPCIGPVCQEKLEGGGGGSGRPGTMQAPTVKDVFNAMAGKTPSPTTSAGSQTSGGTATNSPTANAQATGLTGANAQKSTNVSTSTCASENCNAIPMGSSNSPMKIPGRQNVAATVDGISYTGHALDSMQSRGITPSVVKDALQRGKISSGYDGATSYTTDEIRVIVNPNGTIKTVYPQ